MGRGRGTGALLAVALLAVGASGGWLGRGADAVDEASAPTARRAESAGASELPAPVVAMDEAAAVPDAPEALSPQGTAAAVDAPAGAEPGTPFRITGRVVDANVRGVPGAVVRMLPSRAQLAALGIKVSPFEVPVDVARLSTVLTAGNGTFALEARDVPPKDEAILAREHEYVGTEGRWPMLIVSHPAFETAVRTCRGWSGGPFAVDDIVLTAGASVVGRVLDEQGRPLEGVRIAPPALFDRYDRPDDWTAVKLVLAAASAEDGRFRLDGLWSGKTSLELLTPGRIAVLLKLELREGEELDLGDVVLGLGTSVEGVVVQARDGQPLADARVLLRPPVGLFNGPDAVAQAFASKVGSNDAMIDRETRTDASGAFRLTGLDPANPGMGSTTLDVFAGAPGFEPVKLAGVVPGGEPLRLVLQRAGAIVVTVVDPVGGQAIEDATLAGRRHAADEEWSYTKLEVVSDPASLAELGVPPPYAGVHLLSPAGSYRNTVIISAPGRATRGFVLPTVVAPERASFTAKLPREAGFGGRVVDGGGLPIADAKVTLRPPDDLRVELEDCEELCDAAGRFRFAGLLHGDWDATAAAKDFVTSPSRVVKLRLQAPVEEEFVLQPGGVIAGTVISGGAPQAGGEVRARSVDGVEAAPIAEELGDGRVVYKAPPAVHSWKAVADAEGHFLIDSLAAGDYELTGPPGVEQVVRVAAGETTEVTLRARAYPRLRGRLTDARGPVAGATIGVEPMIGDLAGFQEGAGSGTTGPDGVFDFESQDVGPVRVVGRFQGAFTPAVELDLAWDEVEWVDLRFGGGALSGVVVSAATGDPIEGARVSLLQKIAMASADYDNLVGRTTTDAQGRFGFERLGPGDYATSVTAKGFVRPPKETAVVAEGVEAPELRIAMPAGGAVLGTVKPALPGAALPASLSVRLHFLDGIADITSTGTDANGQFKRDGMSPGRWRAEVRLPTMAWTAVPLVMREFVVVAGQTAEVELTLPP